MLCQCGLLQVVTHQRHSKAADVYSFGIVLWELMTWQLPWDDCNHFQVHFRLLAGPLACRTAVQCC